MRRLVWAVLASWCIAGAATAQEPAPTTQSPSGAVDSPTILDPPHNSTFSKLIPPEIVAQIRDYALQGYLGGLSERELELLRARPQDCRSSAFCNGVDNGRISTVAAAILNERAKASANTSAAWSAVTAWMTLATALFVAWIAYQQWRTARQKLAVDLFERRAAVYDKVVDAATKVIGPGRPVDDQPFRLLHTARSEAQFLFGPEVSDFIRSLIKAVANLGLAHTMMEAERQTGKAEGDENDYPKLNHDSILVVGSAEQELAELLTKYAGFTEGLPPSLWQIVSKRLRRRRG